MKIRLFSCVNVIFCVLLFPLAISTKSIRLCEIKHPNRLAVLIGYEHWLSTANELNGHNHEQNLRPDNHLTHYLSMPYNSCKAPISKIKPTRFNFKTNSTTYNIRAINSPSYAIRGYEFMENYCKLILVSIYP